MRSDNITPNSIDIALKMLDNNTQYGFCIQSLFFSMVCIKDILECGCTAARGRNLRVLAALITAAASWIFPTAASTQTSFGDQNRFSNRISLETASDFMDKVAEHYAAFNDFQANIQITQGSEISEGVLYAKDGGRVRVNFFRPQDQVMVSDGTDFYIYIPVQNTALHQKRSPETSAGSFASKNGLDQLRSRYVASYADKPYFVPMPNSIGAPRQAMQIRMKWRSPSQSFRELVLFIGRDLFIYRVDAVTYNRQSLRFDFSAIQVNQGIPDARFKYDPPPTANVVDNFLFEGASQ